MQEMTLAKRIKCFKYLVYSYIVLLTLGIEDETLSMPSRVSDWLDKLSGSSMSPTANSSTGKKVLKNELSALIFESSKAKALLEYSIKHKSLNCGHRNDLIDIIIEEIIRCNIVLKPQDFKDLFNEICSLFPSESDMQITGAAQIIIGSSLLWGNTRYYGILQNKLWAPSVILLSLGPLTLILCWMGCQAANQKKRCLLGMFSALLITCICIQFIICGWALSMRENLPTSVELYVDDSFVEFLDKFSRTKVDNLHLWNRMQSQLQCCGVDGPLDYRRLSLPWSCCSRAEHAYESVCDTHYKRGCLSVLSDQMKIRLLLTCFSAAVIAFFQSIGLFCAIHLTMLFGRKSNNHNIQRIKRRQQEFLPLSIQDKRNEVPSPLSLSPSAPGHRLMKTAPPPSALSK